MIVLLNRYVALHFFRLAEMELLWGNSEKVERETRGARSFLRGICQHAGQGGHEPLCAVTLTGYVILT